MADVVVSKSVNEALVSANKNVKKEKAKNVEQDVEIAKLKAEMAKLRKPRNLLLTVFQNIMFLLENR